MATLMRVDWIGKREGNAWIVWMQERLEEELEIANIVNIFKVYSRTLSELNFLWMSDKHVYIWANFWCGAHT